MQRTLALAILPISRRTLGPICGLRTVAAAALWFLALGTLGIAQVPSVQYNLLESGSATTARSLLQQAVQFTWDQRGLRDGLQGISKSQRISIWMDPRIDPSQLISFSPPPASAPATQKMLLSVLDSVAQSAAAEAGIIENVVYIGPANETQRIQRAAMELHDAISRRDVNLGNQARLLEWPELSTPQAMLDSIAEQWGVQVDGQLPHDLLHAGSLASATTLATQLTLVAGSYGFEATMLLPTTGKPKFRLQTLGPATRWKATYPKAALDMAALAESRSKYPGGAVQAARNDWTISGVSNFHFSLFAMKAPSRSGAQKTYTFKVQNAATAQIIQTLANNIGLPVAWDATCTQEQKTRLQNLEVTDASIQELLERVCNEAGLEFNLNDTSLDIKPKSK